MTLPVWNCLVPPAPLSDALQQGEAVHRHAVPTQLAEHARGPGQRHREDVRPNEADHRGPRQLREQARQDPGRRRCRQALPRAAGLHVCRPRRRARAEQARRG